jgi:ribonuclease R
MGDKVWVKVVATNLDKRQIDYEWVIASSLKENGKPAFFNEAVEQSVSKGKTIKKKKKKG